jgi:1-deoxy-D-xylulose-5-phosphate synthase
MPEWRTAFEELEIGKGRKISDGEDVAIVTIGHIGNYAQTAINDLSDAGVFPAHYDMRFIKPLDEALLHEVFSKFDKVITVEDGCLPGGFGSAIIEFMAEHNYSARVVRLGIPDEIIEHGEPEQLHKECGYDVEGIKAAVVKLLEHELANI